MREDVMYREISDTDTREAHILEEEEKWKMLCFSISHADGSDSDESSEWFVMGECLMFLTLIFYPTQLETWAAITTWRKTLVLYVVC